MISNPKTLIKTQNAETAKTNTIMERKKKKERKRERRRRRRRNGDEESHGEREEEEEEEMERMLQVAGDPSRSAT